MPLPGFPPNPNDILDRLFRILRPPIPLRFFPREEVLPRRHRIVATTGSKMIWPYRITWKESPRGRGQIKVLRGERTIGMVSYLDAADRMRLVRLLEDIIKGVE